MQLTMPLPPSLPCVSRLRVRRYRSIVRVQCVPLSPLLPLPSLVALQAELVYLPHSPLSSRSCCTTFHTHHNNHFDRNWKRELSGMESALNSSDTTPIESNQSISFRIKSEMEISSDATGMRIIARARMSTSRASSCVIVFSYHSKWTVKSSNTTERFETYTYRDV